MGINPFTGKIEQTTPPLRFNPLAGAFQFSGGTNRIVFDPVSGGFVFAKSTGPVDPLAGIPYRLRFETHWGDKVLLPYFFQDVARTIPLTSEGELMATGGPESAELIPAQPDDSAQAVLYLSGDSTPYFDFDGINDCYPIGMAGAQITYTCLLRSKVSAWNTFWSPVDQVAGSPGDRYGLFSAGSTTWHNDPFPLSVRRDGVDLTSPFNMVPIEDWMVTTVVSNTSSIDVARAIFQLESNFFGNAELIAFFIYDGSPTNSQRNTVEAFYETLKPL